MVHNVDGNNVGDHGCCCKEHAVCGTIFEEDVVVCLHKEQVVVPDPSAGRGKTKEQWAITVNWLTDGVDCCHVGFLPCNYVEHAWVYDGVFCRVVDVFD
jgi:hypothetical protein